MKRNKITYRSMIFIALLIVFSMTMTSCEVNSSYENFVNANSIAQENRTTTSGTAASPQTSGTTGSTASEPSVEPTPSQTTPSNPVNQPTSNGTTSNTLTTEVGGVESPDVSDAAALGLRSIVSIYASNGVGSVSGGSGVIYRIDAATGSAFVITNYHVVSSSNTICNQIQLFLYGLEYSDYAIDATYVGGSANYDLAILYVKNSDVLKNAIASGAVTAATIADSEKVVAGQGVVAIGNPNSDGISVTTGVVSVDSEYITMSATTGVSQVQFRVIRIDAAVNFGNSGGGLFNTKGELIGIVNAKVNSTTVENIGYAIPSNVARAISDNIIDYCFGKDCKVVMRAMLGIEITTLSVSTAYDAETGTMRVTQEIGVHSITAGGLGDGILKVDDVLKSVSLNGRKTVITRQHQVIDTLLDARVGDTVSFEVLRGGATTTVSTTITESCLTEYQ